MKRLLTLSILTLAGLCQAQTIVITANQIAMQSTVRNGNYTDSVSKNWSLAFTGIDPTLYNIVSAKLTLTDITTWKGNLLVMGNSAATGAATASTESKLRSPLSLGFVNTSNLSSELWSASAWGSDNWQQTRTANSAEIQLDSTELSFLYGANVILNGETRFGSSSVQYSGLFITSLNSVLTSNLTGTLTVETEAVPEGGSFVALLSAAGLASLRKKRL